MISLLKKSIALILCTGALLPGSVSADPQEDIRVQVPAANASLQGRHGKSDRKLHIIYWTPSDREPQPQWRERLTRVFQTTADFYEKELRRLGIPAQRLPLDLQADGLLKIHLVKGAHPYAHYNVKSGADIRRECLPALREAGVVKSLDGGDQTLVIFCNMSVWDAEARTMSQNSPYYAGGNARGGTAWQVDSALLDSAQLAVKDQFLKDGQYGRISLGKYNSIFVGGVIHELGHALGLPHNQERPDEAALFGTALMGSGNRSFGEELRGESKGSFLTLTHGLRLASHPLFTGGSDPLPRESPQSKFSDMNLTTEGKTLVLEGRVESSEPIYAVVGYSDPEGNSDYNATTTSAVPDKEGKFKLVFTALQAGKNGELRTVACHVNGLTSGFRGLGYQVDKDGGVNADAARTQLMVQKALPLLDKGQEALRALPAPETDAAAQLAHQIVSRLQTPASTPETTPALTSADTTNLSLADAKADKEEVGYGRPMRDRLPGAQLLLSAGGDVFERGFYAHAPARHEFSLGGKWKTFRGACGVADGSYGKTIFVILADGKEVLRTKLMSAGELNRFDVNVEGVQKLEIVVEDGDDGKGGDWGLWLNPILGR